MNKTSLENFLYLDVDVIRKLLEGVYDGSLADKAQRLMREFKDKNGGFAIGKKTPKAWADDPWGRHLPPHPGNPGGSKRLPLAMLMTYITDYMSRSVCMSVFNKQFITLHCFALSETTLSI